MPEARDAAPGESLDFLMSVNKPNALFSWTPGATDLSQPGGWQSNIHYRTIDHCGYAMTSIALNEKFGSFISNSTNNWPKPTAGGLSSYSGFDWFDQMFIYSCPGCSPPPVPPMSPLSSTKIDHANQEWRIGSATVGSGVRVQTNTFQRYLDHGRHTSIVSPAP